MLRRLGNKSKLLPKLMELFPNNIQTFIDMFMGSGAVTFAMAERCKYIVANDKDGEIYNLFMVLKEHREELEHQLHIMPAHEKLFNYWKVNTEEEPINKAVRFIMLSNFGFLGKPDTFRFQIPSSDKGQLLKFVESAYLSNTIQFMCDDFRNVLPKIGFIKKDFGKPAKYRERAFVYADPPYCGANHNYREGFTEDDTKDLFKLLVESGMRFGISEFKTPFIEGLARGYGLQVNEVEERRTLGNRNTEVLITNYKPVKRQQGSLFPAMGTAVSPVNKQMNKDKKERGENLAVSRQQ